MKDRATGCAHGFGFFFFAGLSVAVRAILLIHFIGVKLTERLSFKSESRSIESSDWISTDEASESRS
ncbi:hypothetical protein N665_0172s0083 [Sinapis alba]|nr:hypothetical protein N665_0172s0083 [Sinapis alba]